MEQLRLDRFLANSGCGTRSEVKKQIRSGGVRVADKIEKDPGRKITPGADPVFWGDTPVSLPGDEYYMLYKKAGTVTATKDSAARTVMDGFQELPEKRRAKLFPVGRLDIDTEGLLLITSDGEMGHRLTSPAWHVEKTYAAVVTGRIGAEQMKAFEQGLDIGDEKMTLPAKLCVMDEGEAKAQLIADWRRCSPENAGGSDKDADGSDADADSGGSAADGLDADADLGGSAADGSDADADSGGSDVDSEGSDVAADADLSCVTVTIREGRYHQVKRMFEAVGGKVLYLKRIQMGPLRLDLSLGPGEHRVLTDEEIQVLRDAVH